MKNYTRLLLGAFLGLIFTMSGIILFIDPYGLTNGPRIHGLNAEKTRRNEDGRRVAVGQDVLSGKYQTMLFGNSRAVDGFSDLSGTQWPGGLHNAGMRGASAFEIARALALAGRSEKLRCIVVALDYSTFAIDAKAKSTYWISALADGDANMALARIALSPHALMRSLQTIQDNISGAPPEDQWPSRYKPGKQLERTQKGARGFLASYRSIEYDPERLDFMMRALDGLSSRGVQVIGLIYPLHAWHEEALIAAGQSEKEMLWRADLAKAFARLAARKPKAPCAADPAGAALWDFSGFQMAPYSTPPAKDATQPQPYFYEAAHFTPFVGRAALDVIAGRKPPPPFANADFGFLLTPASLQAREAAARERRQNWLRTDPNAAWLQQSLARWRKSDPPEPRGPRLPLSRDEQDALNKDIRKMGSLKAPS